MFIGTVFDPSKSLNIVLVASFGFLCCTAPLTNTVFSYRCYYYYILPLYCECIKLISIAFVGWLYYAFTMTHLVFSGTVYDLVETYNFYIIKLL